MPVPYRSYAAASAYRQTDSPDAPWLILFVAAAEDLLTWAGIPQRTDSNAVGFQRADSPERVLQTKEFFNLPPNQSPTALIVGIHRPVGGQRPIEVRFKTQPPTGGLGPYECELIVHTDPRQTPLPDIVTRLRSQFTERLRASPAADKEAEELEDEEPETSEDEDADVEQNSFDVPNSVLHRLVEQLANPSWVASNSESLAEIAKPATIIDGQHRVKGAAACERNIPFAVCALLDCSWAEQVFQFTVVNYSAKGIPDQFITANAALSLTEGELSELQVRLDQAKVKVIEYDLMKVVQYDQESPFFGLVNLSEKADPNRIGYKTMVRVAKDWYSAVPEVFRNFMLPALFPAEKTRRGRIARWRETWGSFFIDFWRTVRDHYQDHNAAPDDKGDNYTLWTVGHSNLMIAIVLLEFQRCFFQDLSNQDENYWEVPKTEEPLSYLRGKLRQRAQKVLGFYPPDFFAERWLTKSLNTSAGRKALTTALNKLLTSKGKYQYGKSPLVTGEID
jgi:hypothetical protein